MYNIVDENIHLVNFFKIFIEITIVWNSKKSHFNKKKKKETKYIITGLKLLSLSPFQFSLSSSFHFQFISFPFTYYPTTDRYKKKQKTNKNRFIDHSSYSNFHYRYYETKKRAKKKK